MVSDPRGVLAAGALIHAGPDTDPALGLLWAQQLLAAGCTVPVLTRVRLATGDLKQLVGTYPAAIRLAADTVQLLEALPATRQVTQDHATYALSHIACDDRVRAQLAPRLAHWRTFARPVGAESAARTWAYGNGTTLAMPHIAASKVEGLAWALTRPEVDPLAKALGPCQLSPRLRKMLEYGDPLWLLSQLGIRDQTVGWPTVNDIRAPWLAAALVAHVLATPTAAKRRVLVKALDQGTIVPRHRDMLVELVEADDPDTVVLDHVYENGTPSSMRDAWQLAWGHCAARASLSRLGQDATAWQTLLGLLPNWHASLGELLDAVADVVQPAAN